MKMRSKTAALLGAGLLSFALFGIAAASAPGATEQGVSPVAHLAANITVDGNGKSDKADCAAGDAIEIDATGEGTTTNGVTVHLVNENGEGGEQNNEQDFTVDNGVVTIAYIKGGNGYNSYTYGGGGVTWDRDLYAPVNGSGNPAGLSHAVFCTSAEVPSGEPSVPPTEVPATDTPVPSQGGGGDTNQPTQPPTDAGLTGNSGPTDTAWLLVVALGVLLASVVVLTPARAKNRR
jgi:hypothetical protein